MYNAKSKIFFKIYKNRLAFISMRWYREKNLWQIFLQNSVSVLRSFYATIS